MCEARYEASIGIRSAPCLVRVRARPRGAATGGRSGLRPPRLSNLGPGLRCLVERPRPLPRHHRGRPVSRSRNTAPRRGGARTDLLPGHKRIHEDSRDTSGIPAEIRNRRSQRHRSSTGTGHSAIRAGQTTLRGQHGSVQPNPGTTARAHKEIPRTHTAETIDRVGDTRVRSRTWPCSSPGPGDDRDDHRSPQTPEPKPSRPHARPARSALHLSGGGRRLPPRL